MVNGKCECGSEYFVPVITHNEDGMLRTRECRPGMVVCPACGTLHVFRPDDRKDDRNYRRFEFNGAHGAWEPALE